MSAAKTVGTEAAMGKCQNDERIYAVRAVIAVIAIMLDTHRSRPTLLSC